MKIGIEIHQQLDTKKLFCPCESRVTDQAPDYTIRRKQRAVLSEMGKFDPAAMAEMKKDRTFSYESYDRLCLVELDEEPPHPLNKEALGIAAQAAMLMGAKIAEEIHVMRKTVVDGSNTSGFQRTALIATDGHVDTKEGKIRIPSICLEEDAARIIEKKDTETTYRLDRLGIPLIEIATSPDIKTPEQAREVAAAIGRILRSVKIKRGLGTIRQDLNVSIEGSERTEIKGVQDLALIPKIVENEAGRQKALLEIKETLGKRKAKANAEPLDVTELFKDTQSKIAKKLAHEGAIYAAKLEGFAGLLGTEVNPSRRFGTELSEYAKSQGTSGLFHSDELPNYGISEEEVGKIKELLKVEEKDAFILIGGPKDKAKKAMDTVMKRAAEAAEKVPSETRRALEDGTSSFMRPLPGPARMYPETDIPPVPAPEGIKKPEMIDERIKRIAKKHAIPEDAVKELLDTGRLGIFEAAVDMGVNNTVAYTTLTAQMSATAREGVKIEKLSDETLTTMFAALSKGVFAKEAIPDMLKSLSQGKTIEQAMNEKGLGGETDIEAIIDEVFREKPELVQQKAFKPLMGIVMQKARGRIDGQKVAQALQKRLK